MRPARNLLAGFCHSAWAALIGLAVIPFYLKYLGIEAYGLIGLFITLQAVLQLLDMGLAPTINREVARCFASGNLQNAGKLLHTLAIVYWGMAGTIALLILSLAPMIAEYWLQSKQLSAQTISNAVMLIGVVIACRWPIALYQGALIGAQRLTISSAINMVMITIANLGAVAILYYVSPTIEAYFSWQAGVGLIHALAMRKGAWKIIGGIKKAVFDTNGLKRIWRFSAGMSGVAITGIVFTQLDKLILSKTLGLEKFGHYMLAVTVVSGLYLIIIPVFNVIYPRFSAFVASREIDRLTELYLLGTRLLSSVVFSIAMILVIFGQDLLQIWTTNPVLASSVAPVISLLAIGSALHGVMFFPYSLQLAFGSVRLPLVINAILIVTMVPLIIFLSIMYGALGGALTWLLLQVLYVSLGTWLTHRKLLRGLALQWLFQDVGIPLLLSILVGVIGYYVTQEIVYSIYVKLVSGFVLALMVPILSFSLSQKLRKAFLGHLRSIKSI